MGGSLSVQVPLPAQVPEEHVHGLRDDLRKHFESILCLEHLQSLAMEFARTSSDLVCLLSPCCRPIREQLQTHEPCASEIAAIYGLTARWSEH